MSLIGADSLCSRREFAGLVGGAALLAAAAPLAFLSACQGAASSDQRTLVDMGGRSVTIPLEVKKLLCTNPIGTVDIYVLDPDYLVGWNFKPQAADAAFLDPIALELPALGVWMGAGSVPNIEEVLAAAPDVLLCFWSADSAGVSMADEIARETRLPVVLLDCNISQIGNTYQLLGEILGASERLDTLGDYFAGKLAQIERVVDAIPLAQRKSVFLSEGKGGLQTDPVGSLHVQDALDLIGTRNVVDLPGTEGQGMGMPNVSLEQIITWNPSAILVSEYSMSDTAKSNLYHEILADANWQNVPAAAAGAVYRIPQSPFSWFGRPPSAMRILGCLWLLKQLYPDYARSIDIEAETVEFFQLCFACTPTPEQLDALLKP